MPSIIIGADLCPIEGNVPFFKAGDASALFHDLLPELASADLRIANLECPLIRKPAPIAKTGPSFGADPDCIHGIKAAGFDVLALANNHIMDHGPEGLRSTLETCTHAGIATVGAGENLAAARRILVRQVGHFRVGILAVAEHEFSIAGSDSWGANPIDLADIVRNLRDRGPEFDFLVVLVHGGAEFHVPSPRLQETCRFLVEMGAGAVIVQHPHCVGGYESYRGGHIVYGQGALVMDEGLYRDLPAFHEGVLVRLDVADDATAQIHCVPFIQSAPAPGARRLTGADEVRFRRQLDEKSLALQDRNHVQQAWNEYCRQRRTGYLRSLLGHHKLFRRLDPAGLLLRLLYSRQTLWRIANLIRCETHREAIETILSDPDLLRN